MIQRFEVGNTVQMTDDAADNYGEKYRNVDLEIISVSKSTSDHPGYDGATGDALYDFQGLQFSLYDYELR